ncbi:hypothetical protein COK34_30740 [Bacillus thuringiensis]|uniref:DUF2326 domain-containing protein n=1 Tax=Bacillus thuringiensis TaxID=1428 RepID=UPI000BEC31CD|nr:DUF2326 domain-containing protein [Bacillus thuringiensis]PDY05771.1 hypothetical protein COM66_10880 [Bacillus cereus]PFF17897.1 hypothetical protein CN332_30390 [Bacillus thuringiensis]PFR46598.1 hypothetical protein COK34_30740 [Bacillus thuringiensis]
MKIEDVNGIVREMNFHKGINLIVDETVSVTNKETGNNVGKTTVLKLIDFCLGADPKIIYIDDENKKEIETVKNYLVDSQVLVTLILKQDLDIDTSNEILIERNFQNRTKKVMKINGENLTKNNGKDFENELDRLIIGERQTNKPTFREIIAHSIRYNDDRINKTLKVLSVYTSLAQYETLYLYLFGISIEDRSKILKKISTEKEFKKRIEKNQSKNELELSLALINDTISRLERKKNTLNINHNYEKDLINLNNTKYQISNISSQITELSLRKEIIIEAEEELKANKSDIDLQQLKRIYNQASENMLEIQKTFEELVNYHNKMLVEKIRFITQDIPGIESEIATLNSSLKGLLSKEKELATKIAKSDTFKDLENIITELNENYRRKGEIDNSISQIDDVDNKVAILEEELHAIDQGVFSEKFKERIKEQLVKFNKIFSKVSDDLYGEKYGISFDIKVDKKTGKSIYIFDSFNANSSSGKKQGEILCFDLAYILFADNEDIPVLHFILNDKKELMHGNQLIKVKDFIKDKNVQLIFSILEDKLPIELNNEKNIIIRLSQKEKLFKIE